MKRKNTKENKKENKNKKNSAKFFSNLNTSSNIEYGYAETNVKSKKVKWIFGGLVLAVFATGVAVPWSLSSCTAQLQKPLSNNLIVIEYPNGGGTETITLEQWLERVQSIKFNSSFLTKYQNTFNSSIIEKLYNEERNAFLKFKAAYEATHDGEFNYSNFGYDLSQSITDIQNEQQKTLNNNKKSFQRSFGNGWLEAWLKELQSNSIYGPQNSFENATTNDIPQMEKAAVEYMKVQAIKQPALARFESASITTTNWVVKDLNLNNPNDITYKDINGVTQTIKANTVGDYFRMFLTSKNTAQPTKITSTNKTTLAVFETKSYIPEYRVPNSMLKNTISNYYKSATISSFDLSGIKPGDSNGSAFSFDATILENLFKVSNLQSDATINNFVAINQISQYRGASNILKGNENNEYLESVTKDSGLIQIINSSSDDSESSQSKSLGSSTNKTLAELISSSSSSDSSSDDSSSTDLSKNFYLAALGINPSSFSSSNQDDYKLYDVKSFNPFQVFIELLLSISNNNKPDFSSYSWIEENWNTIVGSLEPSHNLKNFINLLNDNFTFEEKELKFKGNNKDSFNSSLSNYLQSLSSNDFTYLGTLFTAILTDENAKINYLDYSTPQSKLGYWTLYELSKDESKNVGTYMYVSTEGIKIFSILINAQNAESNHFDSMIMSDLYQTVNASSSDSINLYFDIPTFYSKINNDYLITSILLNDEDLNLRFKFAIAKELDIVLMYNDKEVDDYDTLPKGWWDNTNILSIENKNKILEVYNKFVKQVSTKVSSTLNSNNKVAIEGVDSLLESMANAQRNYDFGKIQENGIDQIIFQTPTKYNSSSVIKGLNEIQVSFLQKIWNIVNVDVEILGGE